MSAINIDQQTAGLVSGKYQGKYTDVTGRVSFIEMDLQFDKGDVEGAYRAREATEEARVLSGLVEGGYQNDQVSMNVILDQGLVLSISGSMRTACDHGDSAFIGMVANVPGDYTGGVFVAWKGLEVCDIPAASSNPQK